MQGVVIAKSLLGVALPKVNISGREILIAMKAYFDGSGDLKKRDFVVLAGVAANDPLWASFDAKWREILDDRDPPAPYIHMREIVNGRKAFKPEMGWDEKKTSQLILDCLMYIQTLDKTDFRAFICTLDLGSYKYLVENGAKLPAILTFLSRFCPELVVKWYLEEFEKWYPQEMHFYFDQGEKFKGRFEERWTRGKKSSGRFLNHWHLVKTVTTADMRDEPALQLADLIAWGQNRRLVSEKYKDQRSWKMLPKVTDAVLPFRKKELTEAQLALFAFSHDLRPDVWSLEL
jgi:hypothetical protein